VSTVCPQISLKHLILKGKSATAMARAKPELLKPSQMGDKDATVDNTDDDGPEMGEEHVIHLGFMKASGARTFCTNKDTTEEARLHQNGWNFMLSMHSQKIILDWVNVAQPPLQSTDLGDGSPDIQGTAHWMGLFRLDTGGYQHATSPSVGHSTPDTIHQSNTKGAPHSKPPDSNTRDTPTNKYPTNPYHTTRTPLIDKEFHQTNDFYLSGAFWLDSVDSFTPDY
jgi:hypothetical protein